MTTERTGRPQCRRTERQLRVVQLSGVAAVANLVATGKLDPKVLQTYPLDEAPQALRAVESGHTLGKIVINLEQTTEVTGGDRHPLSHIFWTRRR